MSSSTTNALTADPFTIRPATIDDMPSLLELESVYPVRMRVGQRVLAARLTTSPGYQFVLTEEDKVLAVLYTQPIADKTLLAKASYRNIHQLASASGNYLQLMSLNVSTSHQGVSHYLLEFIQEWASTRFKAMVAVSRCAHYNTKRAVSYKDYVYQQGDDGLPIDPILKMHVSHGAHIKGIVKNYRQADRINQGHGVLIEYELSQKGKKTVPAQDATHTRSFADCLDKVKTLLLQLLGQQRASAYADTQAIREMGLNSLELMQLQSLLNTTFAIQLSPAFLFRYPTAQAIANWLSTPSSTASATEVNREKPQNEAVAIIGMDCRFGGGVNSVETYWQALASGTDCVSIQSGYRVPLTDFSGVSLGDNPLLSSGILQRGSFIDDVDAFDAHLY